jgi:hypothetical protein
LGGIPSHYTVDLDLVSPVELNGIPTSYQVDINSLPRIQIGIDPITVNPLTLNPVDVSLRVKEIPSVRAHVPANYTVAFQVFGLQVACIRLCGEAQVITEPYVPNPCEECRGSTIVIQPVPVPVTTPPPTIAGTPAPRRSPRKG